ncbi:MAG: hypothetical protein M3552_10460 [Planctomycetota bacterium]|nr:hypothetical protein [Planctomycetaceae bacterium]MDQ3331060.1 hypothetical protein [Planctomycetota bacterium]
MKSFLRIIIVTILLTPTAASAATLSTAEFLALEKKWPELAEKSEALRVEGRVASASSKLIKLRNCPLPFRPAGAAFDEKRQPAGRVEITGVLQRRAGELVFVVTELREMPDDAQVYALKQSAIDAGDPADWYDLAAWAEQRGTFYDDRSLLAKATEARRRGLSVERQSAAGDPAGLVALAKKAKGFGLAELEYELLHESLRVRFEQLRADAKSNLRPLIDDIRLLLSGAQQPLDTWPMDVAARYAAEPLAVYNRADETSRPVLDRIFLAEAQLTAIERLADSEGANGDGIADQIMAVLPERRDLAERYREREIAFHLEHITSSTRAEALKLATRLEATDRADEAKRALTKWLAAHEATQRTEGPSGLVVVAEDYVAVLGDKAAAARLLVEALAANPESTTIPDKLRQLGYVKVDGEWITKQEADTRPVEPIVQAMREGRVVLNMSPEQVRKTLGVPDRIARAASTSQIHEAWIYGARSGLVVHFLRYSAREQEKSRVVGVAKLR